MKKTVSIISLLLIAVMLIGLVGCGNSTPAPAQNPAEASTNTPAPANTTENTTPATQPEEAPAVEEIPHGGTVNLGLNRNPGGFFTPYNAGVVNTYGWLVLEPLAWKKLDGNFYPVLAESWEMNDEKNVMTIHLRDGITFSNGDTFDAEDVVFTHSIRSEFGTQSAIGAPEKIEALDKLTVQFTWPNFGLDYEQILLTQYIYSKETYEEKGLDWMLINMIGTGPYVLQEYIPDVGLTFVRNENYWGDKTPGPDGFTWTMIPDSTAMLAAFLNGELDYMQTTDPNIMAQLEAYGFEGHVDPAGMAFCCQVQIVTKDAESPLSNPDVRAAIYNGVDWEDMAHTVAGPAAYHTDIIGSPFMPYYKDEIEKSKYDEAAAKKALADAGYPDGFDTVIYGAATDSAAMTYLQDALKKLNIRAEVVTVDGSLRASDYVTGKAIDSGLVFSGYGFAAGSPMDRFNKFISPTGTWASGATYDQELVDLWDQVKKARSLEEQSDLLFQYCDMFVNKYHYMFPAYNSGSLYYYQPWYHLSDLANGGNGNDPFGIWVDQH